MSTHVCLVGDSEEQERYCKPIASPTRLIMCANPESPFHAGLVDNASLTGLGLYGLLKLEESFLSPFRWTLLPQSIA